MEGFSVQLDALHARVLVLEEAKRCALLALEMTSLPPEEIAAMSRILREETGAEQTFVLAVHTFSAPHFMPDHALKTDGERRKKAQLQQLVYAAIRDAARDAAARMAEATVSAGQAECLVNSARDVETTAGWWIGNNGSGPVNHTLTVVALEDAAGSRLAALVHYPVQSSVLDGSQLRRGGKAVSGDLAGRMAAALEADWGCPVLFLIGAAGDQAPREKAVGFTEQDGVLVPTDLQDDILPALDALSAEMADAARAAARRAMPAQGPLRWRSASVTLDGKKIERDLHKLHPTRVPPYEPDGENVQTVELLEVGGVRLLGVKPELNCVTAGEIAGSDPLTLVVTLWNGGAKYMADAASCARITYESQNSPFMPGAAEQLVRTARELLKP
ncbi:MAG: hypothetical protein ACI4O7_05065 [Aristaeellaceae bacterium]